jgi:dTDP-N-acetylfucosamine:lipid II N-acetylfucosaminyltransferase
MNTCTNKRPLICHILPLNHHIFAKMTDGKTSLFDTFSKENFTVNGVIAKHVFFMPNIKENENIKKYDEIIHKNKNDLSFPEIKNIYQWFKFIKDMNDKYDIILMHSMFTSVLFLILPNLFPKMYKKMIILFWGGDISNIANGKTIFSKKNLIHYVTNKLLYFSLKRIKVMCTLSSQEMTLVDRIKSKDCKVFQANYKFIMPRLTPKVKKESIFIQIGNSATKTNNHHEVINYLAKFKDEKIKIFCPLSYGSEDYAKEVISLGHKLWGNKFIPMSKLLSPDEYMEHLAQIDILILNHSRQQGLFNSNFMLATGKKVFFNKKSQALNDYNKNGYIVFETQIIKNLNFDDFIKPLSQEESESNRKIIESSNSSFNFQNKWQIVFDQITQ